MKLALTGATGNMGRGVMDALLLDCALCDSVRILFYKRSEVKKFLKKYRALADRIEVLVGTIADPLICASLVKDRDIVVNMCAVIPPRSDQAPQATVECNEIGVRELVAAIEAQPEPPALVHISTVAVYGHRAGEYCYGRVGEPLVPSPLDLYSATKLRGEFAVLQSRIERRVVLRQTAILHHNMFSDNLHDGLMFHTTVDSPLEWVTAADSGRLIAALLRRFKEQSLPSSFWKKVYNIGGGSITRNYGYQTYNDGFALIGCGFTDFFAPGYNATRNFHGMWFSDSDALEELFAFRSQSCADFWREMARLHRIYALGKCVPKGLIRRFAVKRLLGNYNAPAYWYKHGEDAKLTAYFGGREAYEALQTRTWQDMPLPVEKPPCAAPTPEQRIEAYGYDIEKPDEAVTAADLNAVAAARGGKCMTADSYCGDLYADMEWETCDGERFVANAYTVLRAGHWFNPLYTQNVWDFDRLAKHDRLLARLWYATHAKNEDNVYYLDEDLHAHMRKLQ